MNRLSIGQRIAASFALLILPIAIAAIFFLSQQAAMFQQIRVALMTETAKGELLAGHSKFLSLQQDLHQAIAGRNAAAVGEVLDGPVISRTDFVSDELLLQSDGVAGLQSSRRKIENELLIYGSVATQIWEAAVADDWEKADLLLNNEMAAVENELEMIVYRFDQTSTTQQLNEGTFDITTAQGDTVLLTVLGFGGIIGLILVVGFLLTFSVAIPLNRIKESIQTWQSGDLTHRMSIWGRGDFKEIAEGMNDTVGRMSHGSAGNRSHGAPHMLGASTVDPSPLNNRIHALETSLTIAQHAASVRDLTHLLPRLIELLRQRYNLYHAAVYLIEDQTELLVLEAGTLINDRRTMPINERSLVGWVAKHQRPGLAEDVTQDPRYYESGQTSETKSELALPLMAGNLFLGVLDLHNASDTPFGRDHVLQFQSIADLIAMSVRNLQIIEGGRARLHLADALKEIGEVLVSSSDLPDLFELMLKQCEKLIDFDGAAVLLWNGKMLEVSSNYKKLRVPTGTRITPDYNDPDDVFMTIQEEGRPYIVDVPKALKVSKRWQSLFLGGCWMGIPFLNESGVAGIACFARFQSEPFSAEDRSIATTIINQSWLALENFQQKEKIARLREQMEFELRNRTEAVQAAYTDLERLDQTKSRFVSIASHELKTPITIIRGYGDILQRQEKIQSDPQNKRIVDGILKGVNRINELVENLLDLTRIDYRTLEIRPEPIRMKDLFDNIKNYFEPQVAERKITLEFEESTQRLPIIDADLVGIRKIFEHLINNAVKYTPDGGEITVSASSWLGGAPQIDWPDDGVHIMIRDTGIGIDIMDQKLIFEKFFQIGEVDLHSTSKVEFRGGGPGLGLAIVRGIVTAHNGMVWAQSPGYDEEALPGSTFHVVLPRRQTSDQVRPDLFPALSTDMMETALSKAVDVNV